MTYEGVLDSRLKIAWRSLTGTSESGVNQPSSTEPIVGLTLGSIETEAVSSQREEIVGMISELAADVVGFRGQAAMGLN